MASNNDNQNDKKELNNNKLFQNDSKKDEQKSKDNKASSTDQNIADQASQNSDASLKQVPDSDEVTQDNNPDHPTKSNVSHFNKQDAKKTTMEQDKNPNYIGDDAPIELGDDLDADIDTVKKYLNVEHTDLQKIDLNADDCLNHMRNILLHMNRTQTIMYKLVDYYAKNTMEYRKFKNNLVNSSDKDKLKELLGMWKPLFNISDKKQVNTFVRAVNSIQEISKNGSLDNLKRLAHYFNEKKGKIDLSKVKSDTAKQNSNDSSDDVNNNNVDHD